MGLWRRDGGHRAQGALLQRGGRADNVRRFCPVGDGNQGLADSVRPTVASSFVGVCRRVGRRSAPCARWICGGVTEGIAHKVRSYNVAVGWAMSAAFVRVGAEIKGWRTASALRSLRWFVETGNPGNRRSAPCARCPPPPPQTHRAQGALLRLSGERCSGDLRGHASTCCLAQRNIRLMTATVTASTIRVSGMPTRRKSLPL